jgi:hypothetical protein
MEPVYVWNLGVDNQHFKGQILVCEGCDAEHRTNLKTVLQIKQWKRDNIKTTSTERGDRNAS